MKKILIAVLAVVAGFLPARLADAHTETGLMFDGPGVYGPIVAGGQEVLDSGAITLMSYSDVASCAPDDDCTVWLTGHTVTHGAVFGPVLNYDIGTSVTIYDGHTHSYVIGYAQTVDRFAIAAASDVIYGDLVLQASLSPDIVMLLYAEEVSVITPQPVNSPAAPPPGTLVATS